MQITQEQIASETQVDDTHAVVAAVKAAGAKKPKFVLVFDENEAGTDFVVRVFYHSAAPLIKSVLDVPVVPMGTKCIPEDDEVIKTTYPDKYLRWCGVIGGKPVWIP